MPQGSLGKRNWKKSGGIRFDLSGFEGVEAVLGELGKNVGPTVERKLSRAALGAGLTEAARLIRKAAPRKSRLKKSVGTRFKKDTKRGQHTAKAGLNVGKKNGTAPHAHFFTLGTAQRHTRRGLNRGRVVPNFFVKRAIEMGEPSIARKMIERIHARLPIEIINVVKAKNPSGLSPNVKTRPYTAGNSLPVHDY